MSSEQIRQRTVSGSIYSVAASAITIGLGLIRFVLLLRFLGPADFGVAAQALLFVELSHLLRLPGLQSAFIQRKTVSAADLSTYFSMRTLAVGGSSALMIALAPLIGRFYPDMPLLPAVMIAFFGIELLKGFNIFQESLQNRALAFRPIALADGVSALLMTIVAPLLAWWGWGPWSLVMERLVGHIGRFLVLLFMRLLTWPGFGWDRAAASWFFNFGIKVWGNNSLTFLTDRFDDFWIGRALGQTALGYYSRAYEAARYPRRLVANPILGVFFATFSRLQDDRLRLSRAFFRAMSLMIRVGLLFSLIFVLSAPELITLLGEKWRPLQLTFQLMIVYTMLDPLATGASNLIIAVGQPQLVVRTRLLQTAVFLPAVILLGNAFGIAGVAVAADLMVAVGALTLFIFTRRFVDYSSFRLGFWPALAALVTGTAVWLLTPTWQALNPWLALASKGLLSSGLYTLLLYLTEREQLRTGVQMLRAVVKRGNGKLKIEN